MPCYKPLEAYYTGMFNPSGKPRITFNPEKATRPFAKMDLPCGRCIGCRLAKSKDWAIRCMHESQMHIENSYLTLTYDDNHIPPNRSLLKSDFQKFIRALRQSTKLPLRYYMCGEYGSKCEKHETKDCPECGPLQRPHYHAILFGYGFPDKTLWQIREKNQRVYRSAELEKHWHHGNSEIGAVNIRTAGYVARYIMKKQNGSRAKNHYGERLPEYTQMSLRPGIGKTWYDQFKNDIFPADEVVFDGRKHQTPSYYRLLLSREDPELYEQLRELRIEKAKDNPDNTESRLATREICKQKQADRLERNFL